MTNDTRRVQRKEHTMKKTKRILALIVVILLVLLYLSTLIFALLDAPVFTSLLKASVAATILLPVLLYGFLLFHRLSDKNEQHEDTENNSKRS